MSQIKVAAINHPSAPSGGLAFSSSGNVTGAGLDLIVTQTFSAASTVSVNNCFSSTYDNYRIVLKSVVSTPIDVWFRLRSAGVDNTTASSYTVQRLLAESTSVTGFRESNTYWTVGSSVNTLENGLSLDLYSPFLAANTSVASVSAYSNGSGAVRIYAGGHTATTSFDGFTMLPSSSTITGTLRVYGYRN